MDKGRVFCGLAVMVGLIVLGAMIPRAVEKYRSYDRTVNVKGLCEKEVKADKVIWPVVYKVMANDIQSIYDQTDSNNASIISFLKCCIHEICCNSHFYWIFIYFLSPRNDIN